MGEEDAKPVRQMGSQTIPMSRSTFGEGVLNNASES